MKKLFYLCLIIFIGFASFSDYAEAKPKPSITSNKQNFDPSTGLYHLSGNVRVATSSRVITADSATVDIAGLQVWAKDNITLKQDDIVFTGESLYVYGKSKRAEITGNLYFKRNSGLAISSDYGEYNWGTKIATFTGNVVVKYNNGETKTYSKIQYNVVQNKFL